MSSFTSSTSLKRSPSIRSRKPATSPHHRSGTSPLHIIPELSENEFEFSPSPSPTPPMRPSVTLPAVHQSSKPSSRVTLSAYTFSIDDALLVVGDATPGSPALSASSISDSLSSEDIPMTPGASDDEDSFALPRPRVYPRRATIRPLCINKPQPFISLDEGEGETPTPNPEATPHVPWFPEHNSVLHSSPIEDSAEEDHEFYAREIGDLISCYAEDSSAPIRRGRPDSIILSDAVGPFSADILASKSQSGSRFSKALPSPPILTPSLSTFPSVPTFSLVQITAQSSVVRRKRTLPNYPPPPPPTARPRPPPRTPIPTDISNAELESPSQGPVIVEQVWFDDEEGDVQSHPLLTSDSDTSCASVNSPLSSYSSEAHRPISPFSFPASPSTSSHSCDEKDDDSQDDVSRTLRSRWSTSTIGSLPPELPRTGPAAIFSPFKTVFCGRSRRAGNLKAPVRSQTEGLLRTRAQILPAIKHSFSKSHTFTTPSPPSSPIQFIRRRGSRSSTSSGRTSQWSGSSDCDSCKSGSGSGSGLNRKPIPVEMFLRR